MQAHYGREGRTAPACGRGHAPCAPRPPSTTLCGVSAGPLPSGTARREHAALAFEGVGHRYRAGWRARRTALEALELRLDPGSSLGLVGPNGAGKSTCLRLAAGLELPSEGRVRVFGREAHERRGRLAHPVGYAAEGFPFPAELSARAALVLLARLSGMGRGARRSAVPAMLERVGLASRGRLAGFSRGMQRRFALAQAFLGEPALLLLDEPTTGLDAEGFALLAELLAEARARGAALVIASHLPALLVEHCDQALVLNGGRVQARGAARELLPASHDLAALAALYGAERRS